MPVVATTVSFVNFSFAQVFEFFPGYWDARQRERGGLALQARAQAPIEKSHYDPVVDLVWLSSKTGSEFVTTSTDGKMLWWDTRKLDEPTDWTELDEGPLGPDGKVRVVGGTGIEYVPDAGVRIIS